jgi:hypothetical protein
MSEASHVRSFGRHHYVNRIGRHEYMWLAHLRDAGSHLIRGSFADGVAARSLSGTVANSSRVVRPRTLKAGSRSRLSLTLDQLGAGRQARPAWRRTYSASVVTHSFIRVRLVPPQSTWSALRRMSLVVVVVVVVV